MADVVRPALSDAGAEGGYRLIKKIPIPGHYGWDYLTADSEGRRLYVSHDREVVVLDLDFGAIIGKIPGQTFPASQSPRISGAASSVADPGSVMVFELKTLAVLDQVT
jgi:hypothetical protein